MDLFPDMSDPVHFDIELVDHHNRGVAPELNAILLPLSAHHTVVMLQSHLGETDRTLFLKTLTRALHKTLLQNERL